MRMFTVGHSTHACGELAALLTRHRVELVADVRRTPHSRRHPRFNRESLAAELPEHGVAFAVLCAGGAVAYPPAQGALPGL
jgi:uncharacterized protein (DUF488 family)